MGPTEIKILLYRNRQGAFRARATVDGKHTRNLDYWGAVKAVLAPFHAAVKAWGEASVDPRTEAKRCANPTCSNPAREGGWRYCEDCK